MSLPTWDQLIGSGAIFNWLDNTLASAERFNLNEKALVDLCHQLELETNTAFASTNANLGTTNVAVSDLSALVASNNSTTTTALTSKANLVSGKVAKSEIPSTRDGLGVTDIYTKSEVDSAVAGLVNGAPGALNTLKELADSLGSDSNYAATVTNALALKANAATVSTEFSNEATARTLADNSLSARITNEVNNRTADISGLQTQLTTEANTRAAAVTTINTALGTKATLDNITGKVPQSQLPSTRSGLGLTDVDTSDEVDAKIASVIGSASSAMDTLKELEDAIVSGDNIAATLALTVGLKESTADVITKVAAEAALRISADNALTTAVNTEVTDRQTAITNLTTVVSTKASTSYVDSAVANLAGSSTITDAVAAEANLRTNADALKLNLAGGTLTGNLTLVADPTIALHAATKQYVDSKSAGPIETDVSGQVGYAVTTSLATALTLPATAGYKYVIKSIVVTNIGTTDDSITVLSTVNGVSTYFAKQVPIKKNCVLEVLTNVKVLYPSDLLQFQALANSTLHVSITYSAYAANTTMIGVGAVLGSSLATIYTATADTAIQSILVSNISGSTGIDRWVSIYWTDASDVIQGYFAYQVNLPKQSSVDYAQNVKRIPVGHKIRAYASSSDLVTITLAGQRI